jgi:NADH-ubiquinone oxidoreductase chain 2
MVIFSIIILIVAKALPVLNTKIYSIHVTRITTIVFLFSGALTFNTLNLENLGTGIGVYSGLFQVTTISQLIEIFLFWIGGGILMAWPQKKPLLITDKETPFQAKGQSKGSGTDYSLIVLFSSLGSSLLISSYDLISVYLSIELQSFGLYILSTLYRDSESATSAGLKYFLLGGLSSCIILLGTGIIYSYTGTTNLESLYIINSVIDVNQQYIIQGISLGLSLIFIGFLFKIAAAPLHNWSPDVYDGTPTIVTTWLTIIPKIAILFILLELQIKLGIAQAHPYCLWQALGPLGGGEVASPALGSAIAEGVYPPSPPCVAGEFATQGQISKEISIIINNNILKFLLLISATLSLIIGSLLGLAQIRIKRLLAYSTISHIGFILLALAVNTEQSIDSFIFYIIQYTLTNLNIFLVILGLAYIINNTSPISPNIDRNPSNREGGGNKDISFISEFKGLFFSNPLLSISLAVSLFSMAGIPPLIGFFSKQLVLYSALQNGYYFISVLAIIVSVISCSYYLQIIKILFTPHSHSALAALAAKAEGGATGGKEMAKAIGGVEYTIPACDSSSCNEIILTNTHSYLISTLTFTILLFFIKPSLILNSTQLLSLSLFYI